MNLFEFLLLVGVAFGMCWLVDIGFTKAFRSAPQHKTGKSVRLNRHFGGVGTALIVLGILGLISSLEQGWLLAVAGVVLVLAGIGLAVYYMTFGLYYDDDQFVLTTFGKRSQTYRFSQIKAQQLYNSYGKLVVELYLCDGRAVQLQDSMTGTDAFLDTAARGWQRQLGLTQEDCSFYNPDQSCWFPPMEE